jgi:hypothetical protein
MRISVKTYSNDIYLKGIPYTCTNPMEQLHILRCQVWKSHLRPKRSISVQGFKEAVR